jgi:hypothetical protein
MKVYVTDNVTQVCAPYDIHVTGYGLPAKGAMVAVVRSNGEVLNQGLTDDAGQITIRGAHDNDNIIVSIGNSSAASTIHCTPSLQEEQSQLESQEIIIQPDPFTLAINMVPLSNDSIQVQVKPSIDLPYPPQAQLWQEGSSQPIQVPLSYDSGLGLYIGQAILNTTLDLRGYTRVNAADSLGGTVARIVLFSVQTVNPIGTTKLTSSDGQLEIFLQEGSLIGNPVVSIQPTDQVNLTQGELTVKGKSYSITTSNGEYTLQQPATLNIYYSNNQLKLLQSEGFGLYQWDASNGIWILISTATDLKHQFVSAQITELGTFAVMALPLHVIHLPLVNR